MAPRRIWTPARASAAAGAAARLQAYAYAAITAMNGTDGMGGRAAALNTTAIDPKLVHARVATYRNAYGTHFQCTSTCYFTMLAYLATIAALLAVLAVIPVQSPSKPENAPFVLWFGNDHPEDDGVFAHAPDKQAHGLIDRLSMWLYGRRESEKPEIEVPEESFHEDIDLVTEDVEPVKTFESIGVETDDSLLPPILLPPQPDDCILIEDVDTLFDPLPPKSPSSKKPGIFSPATPRNIADAVGSETNVVSEPDTLLRRGPMSPLHRGSSIAGRRASVGSAASDMGRETLLVAVERRNSMQKRADKRKEYAKSDIAHDNLHEHELHMYEYLEFVRSLLEGTSIKKITRKSAKVVKRTFFITPNLSTVYWNQVGNKGWINKKSSIDTAEISRVVKGIEGSTNLQSKGKQDKQALYLSVIMNDGKHLDLEAKDEETRQRLFLGFTCLAVEKREEKRKSEAGEQEEAADKDVSITDHKQADQARPQETGGDDARNAEEVRAGKSEQDDPKHWRVEPELAQAAQGSRDNQAEAFRGLTEDETKDGEEAD